MTRHHVSDSDHTAEGNGSYRVFLLHVGQQDHVDKDRHRIFKLPPETFFATPGVKLLLFEEGIEPAQNPTENGPRGIVVHDHITKRVACRHPVLQSSNLLSVAALIYATFTFDLSQSTLLFQVIGQKHVIFRQKKSSYFQTFFLFLPGEREFAGRKRKKKSSYFQTFFLFLPGEREFAGRKRKKKRNRFFFTDSRKSEEVEEIWSTKFFESSRPERPVITIT